MDLKKMEYFIAAAEEGTFTKAAGRCYISQTAISQQIAGLEKELNVSLFDRSQYRPRLTPAGKKFYEYCKKLFSELEQAIEEVRALDRVDKQDINIGITGSFERIMIASLLKEYAIQYPDITINFVEHTVKESVEKLRDGEIDVLFANKDDMRAETNLDVYPLYINRICIVVPPDHKFADRKEVKGEELKDEKFVIFSPKVSPSIYKTFISACKKDGYMPKIAQEVESPWDIAVMVSIGKGIAIASENIRLDHTVLRTVRLVDSAHKGEYCLVKAKSNTTKEVTDFIKISTKECAKN